MGYPNLFTPEEHLAEAKKRLNVPCIVAVCGSTKFMDLMAEADLRETAAGNIVVKPGCNMKEPHELWADPGRAEELKVELDGLHRAKIRMADEVLVVGDYIGSSTTAEVSYARELGKPVRFTHPEVDPEWQHQPAQPREEHPDGTSRDSVLMGRTFVSLAGHLHAQRQAADVRGEATWSLMWLDTVFAALAESDPVKLLAALDEASTVSAAWRTDLVQRIEDAKTAPQVHHRCVNCDGVRPEKCLYNPDRVA